MISTPSKPSSSRGGRGKVFFCSSDDGGGSNGDDDALLRDKTLLSKRDLMKRVAGGASVMLSSSSGLILPGLVPSSAFAAAGEEASSASVALPKIPRTEVPLKFTQEYPSAVIKGCWQLSGGHKGDPADDRTSKDKGAVEDFETFVNAGITTFDTGPASVRIGDSELVIGDFFKAQSKQ